MAEEGTGRLLIERLKAAAEGLKQKDVGKGRREGGEQSWAEGRVDAPASLLPAATCHGARRHYRPNIPFPGPPLHLVKPIAYRGGAEA